MPIKSEQAIRVLRYRGDDWNEDDRLLRQAMDFGATAISERDALAARVAELEGVIRPYYDNYMLDEAEDVDICPGGRAQHMRAKAVGEALASTPAQSLAKVQAAALREAAGTLGVQAPIRTSQYDDFGSGKEKAWEDCMDLLESMASRLEAEAANG